MPKDASIALLLLYTKSTRWQNRVYLRLPGIFSLLFINNINRVLCMKVAGWGSLRFWGACHVHFEYWCDSILILAV